MWVPGRTCVEQARAVQEWRHKAQIQAAEDIGFGVEHPSALERVTGLNRLDHEWTDRTMGYLDAFGAGWADRLLVTVG